MPIGGNDIIKRLRETTLYERIDFLERVAKNEKKFLQIKILLTPYKIYPSSMV